MQRERNAKREREKCKERNSLSNIKHLPLFVDTKCRERNAKREREREIERRMQRELMHIC